MRGGTSSGRCARSGHPPSQHPGRASRLAASHMVFRVEFCSREKQTNTSKKNFENYTLNSIHSQNFISLLANVSPHPSCQPAPVNPDPPLTTPCLCDLTSSQSYSPLFLLRTFSSGSAKPSNLTVLLLWECQQAVAWCCLVSPGISGCCDSDRFQVLTIVRLQFLTTIFAKLWPSGVPSKQLQLTFLRRQTRFLKRVSPPQSFLKLRYY